MIKVFTRINRYFKPYAVSINFKNEDVYKCVDGSYQVWIRKDTALKLANNIREKLDANNKNL